MQVTHSRLLWLLPVVALVAISSSCSDDQSTGPALVVRNAISHPPNVPPGPPTDAGKPVTLSFVTTGSSLVVNTTATVEVQVVDKKGAPVAGRPVSWTSINDGASAGSFNPAQGVTNASGRASTTFTAGTSAAVEHVTATSGTASASLNFNLLPGPVTRMEKVGSEANGELTFQCTPHVLSVRVTDQYGNGIVGHTVNWIVTNLPNVILPSTTIAGGYASSTWSPITLGPLASQASAVDGSNQPLIGSPVSFSFTIVEDPDPGACD
jgi:protocatechuate 3,4-dioxygenase beta subunit